jgi:hypothetical protein
VPRLAHAKGHPGCQFTSWAACDKSQQMRWGQCVSITGDREPTPCTRWAVSEKGLCGQHYASVTERQRKEAKEAARMADMNARADAYIAWSRDHPAIWGDRPRVRKRPHKLTVPE